MWWQVLPKQIIWPERCFIGPYMTTTIDAPKLVLSQFVDNLKMYSEGRSCTDSAKQLLRCSTLLVSSNLICLLQNVASRLPHEAFFSLCVQVGRQSVWVFPLPDMHVIWAWMFPLVTVQFPLQGKEQNALRSEEGAKKHARASRLLFKGGALSQSTCGHQIWDIPPTSMKRLRAAAAWTSGGYRAGVCTTTFLSITETEPASRLHSEVITEERAWQLLLRRFERVPRKRRWFQSHSNVIAIFFAIQLELEWKPLTATHWINDLEETWTFDLSQTFDFVPIVTDIQRASMRCLWSAASLHRHAESLAVNSPDLTVLRRHLHSLRKRVFLERAATLQLAACGGLWPEQRRHEAFFKDQANCSRCDTAEIETEERQFCCCKGNTAGDPDLVAKTGWILPGARVGLTKPELRTV